MACRHSDTAAALGTTAQIARAVEMLRLSSNHDKRLWLNRLLAMPCKADDACRMQTVCAHAYDEHLKAFDMIESARHRMDQAEFDASAQDASAEAMLGAAALAQRAQRLLKESRRLTRDCAENEAVIRQRYRLR
jgi:hypothetical protein